MCADVVIVGAGPVGLWTAIQIKKHNPDLDVQMYERHAEYERSHILKLEHASTLLYAKNDHKPAEKRFFRDIMGKNLRRVFQAAATGGHVFIRTNDLEASLKTYAESLNIHINYETVESPETLTQKHPECDTFIAADGARSKIRTALMGEDSVRDYPLQHVVEIKYEARGVARPLSSMNQYKTNKMIASMAFEYVGHEKEGMTPVTLRFFVDAATYDALPEASFKQPLKLNDPRLPEKLAGDIRVWLNARATRTGEIFYPGSDKLGKLTLSLYKAKQFAIQKDGKSWFLAGDAAMGVPYFRSLNAGMIISSQLGFILTRKQWSNSAKVTAYNALQPLDTTWEFTAAMGKNIVLNLYDSFLQAGARMPWGMMKWGRDDAAELKTRSHPAFLPAPRHRKQPKP